MSLDLAVRERSGWIEGGGEGPVTKRRWRYSGRGRSHSKWGGGKRRRDKGWRVGNAFFYLFKLKLICNQKKIVISSHQLSLFWPLYVRDL